MNKENLEKKFQEMGARVAVRPALRHYGRWYDPQNPGRTFADDPEFRIDIRRDRKGEYFDIQAKKTLEIQVLDIDKKDRHLLLMAKLAGNQKAKFLCGHDERNWFTCAIPETAGASTVIQAKQALKPKALVELEKAEGIKSDVLHKRNKKLKSGRKIFRQGEFFFVPQPDFQLPKNALILRHESMRGGGQHAHVAEYLYRKGGEDVWVRGHHVLTPSQFAAVSDKERGQYRMMKRNPEVWVKGKVVHEEHSTVELGNVWCRVHMNTEAQSKFRATVAFLD